MKLGCGSPDGTLEFVTCDNGNLEYDKGLCKELIRTQLNLKLGVSDDKSAGSPDHR